MPHVMESVDFSIIELEEEYEDYQFVNSHFAGVNLSSIKFISCTFDGCDLSLANLQNSAFQEVLFENCKMLGLHFDHCNSFLFEVSFKNCQLNLSSFYGKNLKQSSFQNCLLHEVDFVESNLEAASFLNCDFLGSQFDQTNLVGSNLETSINYVINPEQNKINKAKFSYPGVLGLLQQYNIDVQ